MKCFRKFSINQSPHLGNSRQRRAQLRVFLWKRVPTMPHLSEFGCQYEEPSDQRLQMRRLRQVHPPQLSAGLDQVSVRIEKTRQRAHLQVEEVLLRTVQN